MSVSIVVGPNIWMSMMVYVGILFIFAKEMVSYCVFAISRVAGRIHLCIMVYMLINFIFIWSCLWVLACVLIIPSIPCVCICVIECISVIFFPNVLFSLWMINVCVIVVLHVGLHCNVYTELLFCFFFVFCFSFSWYFL